MFQRFNLVHNKSRIGLHIWFLCTWFQMYPKNPFDLLSIGWLCGVYDLEHLVSHRGWLTLAGLTLARSWRFHEGSTPIDLSIHKEPSIHEGWVHSRESVDFCGSCFFESKVAFEHHIRVYVWIFWSFSSIFYFFILAKHLEEIIKGFLMLNHLGKLCDPKFHFPLFIYGF